MPYYRKRKYKRKRKGRYYTPAVRLLASPSRRVQFKYCDTFIITPGATGLASWHHFAGNGLYDPNLATGGRQPFLYDQLVNANGYDKYYVVSSRIKVEFVNEHDTHQYVIALLNTDNQETFADMEAIRELPGTLATTKLVDNTNRKATITRAAATSKFFPMGVETDVSSGAIFSNPSNVWYWSIGAVENNGEAVIGDLRFNVTIWYNVVLYNQGIPLTSS